MTVSDYRKVLKQLESKPARYEKFVKLNAPKKRSCGKSRVRCQRCSRTGAHISQYSLNLCRQCFREIASKIGFKKFN